MYKLSPTSTISLTSSRGFCECFWKVQVTLAWRDLGIHSKNVLLPSTPYSFLSATRCLWWSVGGSRDKGILGGLQHPGNALTPNSPTGSKNVEIYNPMTALYPPLVNIYECLRLINIWWLVVEHQRKIFMIPQYLVPSHICCQNKWWGIDRFLVFTEPKILTLAKSGVVVWSNI